MRLPGVGLLLTLGIVSYALFMNTLLVERQRELRELDRYRVAVDRFLGAEFLRERWMAIYKDHRKIGFSGLTIEKVPAESGIEFYTTLEMVLEFDLFGRGQHLTLDARLTQDNELKPLLLHGELGFDETTLQLSGKREGPQFVLSVRQGKLPLVKIPLPLEDLYLGDGFTPALPVAGYSVGESFHVPCFDPVSLRREVVEVDVVSMESREVDGFQADTFTLETRFGGVTSESRVTRDGELLLQKFGPPLEGVILRREPRHRARRGFTDD